MNQERYVNIILPHGTKIFRTNTGTDEEPAYTWHVWPRVGIPTQHNSYLTALDNASWHERRCRTDEYANRVVKRIQMEMER